MGLSCAFPSLNPQVEAARRKDLAELEQGILDLVTSVHQVAAHLGAKPEGLPGQATSFACSSLCPRDFGKEVFDGLPAFQALVNECFSLDAAFHVSVSHTRKPEEERNPFERVEKQEATIVVAVKLNKNFRDGVIIINGDEFVCTMSQVISARDYATIPVYRPLKLKAPVQAV